jgi:hypothetical protein
MGKQRITVPYLSYQQLQEVAAQFLEKYHPKGAIPIPIEEIVDLRFELDIIPTPGLHKGFDIGCISSPVTLTAFLWTNSSTILGRAGIDLAWPMN